MKRKYGALLIGLILAAVATVLLIAIPSSANLYAAYVFCLIGIAAPIAASALADEKDALSTYAILWQCAWLLPVSLLISTAVLLLQGFEVFILPLKWHIVIQLIPAAVAVVRVVAVYTGKEYVRKTGSKAASRVMQMNTLIADVNALAGRADTLPEDKRTEAKQSIKQVSEALQYSDPVSTEAVQTADEEIAQAVSALSELFTTEHAAEIAEACRALCEKIRQRNERLKFSKRG